MKPVVLTVRLYEQTIHSCNAYLLNSYFMPGIVLGPGDIVVNHTDKVSVSTNVISKWRK